MHHARQVRVGTQQYWSLNPSDPRGDGLDGRQRQLTVDHVLQQVIVVVARSAVNGRDAFLQTALRRKRAERGTLLCGERIEGKCIRGVHALARRFRNPSIVIAAHRRQFELVEKVHGLARPERPRDAITEVDRSIGAALANVVKRRLECGQIAVDVGDDGEAQGDFSILPGFPGSVLCLSAFCRYCQRARGGQVRIEICYVPPIGVVRRWEVAILAQPTRWWKACDHNLHALRNEIAQRRMRLVTIIRGIPGVKNYVGPTYPTQLFETWGEHFEAKSPHGMIGWQSHTYPAHAS